MKTACTTYTHAVHKVGPVKQSKHYGQTDGRTKIINLIVGLVTLNSPKNKKNSEEFPDRHVVLVCCVTSPVCFTSMNQS